MLFTEGDGVVSTASAYAILLPEQLQGVGLESIFTRSRGFLRGLLDVGKDKHQYVSRTLLNTLLAVTVISRLLI